jgi:hypothetical protein
MQNPSAIRTRSRAKATSTRQLSWSFFLLVIICACVVAAGFFFAARQHFTSMDYGIKNSKLREQLQNLEVEKRRLMLAREMALSPVAIRKAARSVGLKDSSEVAAVPTSGIAAEKVAGAIIKARATDEISSGAATPAVVRTSMSTPVRSKTAQPKQTGETRARVVDEPSKRSEIAALIKFR